MNERFYWSLYRIRRVEEELCKVYPSPIDKVKSPMHLSIGQEAVSVGVCEALKPQDVVFGTYRSHALYLAKGGDLNAMIAELYGKATGCARGKGGSMHLIDVKAGVMGTSAVVGTTIPNAVGYAYGLRYQQKDGIVVSFFGDGATDEGVFYESLNWAELKRLPMLFVCENNGLAIHTRQTDRQANPKIWQKASAQGLLTYRLTDNVFDLYRCTKAVIDRARQDKNGGPVLFEVATSRWKEHVGPGEDFHLGYRTKEEVENWVENDQVKKVGQMLDKYRKIQIENEIESDIKAAFEFAENSPFPKQGELFTDI